MMNQIRYSIVLNADCNTEIFVLQKNKQCGAIKPRTSLKTSPSVHSCCHACGQLNYDSTGPS